MSINICQLLPSKYYEFFQVLCVDICRKLNVPFKSSEKYRQLEDACIIHPFLAPVIEDYLLRYANTRIYQEWLEIHDMISSNKKEYDALPDSIFHTLCWMRDVSSTKFVTKQQLQDFVDILEYWQPIDPVLNDKRLVLIYKIEEINQLEQKCV